MSSDFIFLAVVMKGKMTLSLRLKCKDPGYGLSALLEEGQECVSLVMKQHKEPLGRQTLTRNCEQHSLIAYTSPRPQHYVVGRQ